MISTIKILDKIFSKHVEWRKSFHLRDPHDFITENDKSLPDFRESQDAITKIIEELMEKLKKNRPFFSPKYIGHMNWEVMIPTNLAFFAASLFNPNNVARAGGTGTSELEFEVGKDFARLFGFDVNKAWGHITAGGTISNIEALWIARNMKVYPIILRRIFKRLRLSCEPFFKYKRKSYNLNNYSDKELIKMFVPEELVEMREQILSIAKKHYKGNKNDIDNYFEELSMQSKGLKWDNIDVGVVIFPETKHYSLKKAMDILGLGAENIRYVPVDEKYRMDIKILREIIEEEIKERPILAVVGVLGSTEESAVDEIHKIIKLRKEMKKKGVGFHIHIDAAYGGYVRTIFLDENNRFMGRNELMEKLKEMGIIGDKNEKRWPEKAVYDAYKSVSEVDTITVDPHKLGYVLYPAGGFVMRDKRMRDAIATFAPYVFPKPDKDVPDVLIGAYILEGSKPGASAAAVWTAHRILPLNIYGYGKLIGETIDGALSLYYGIRNSKDIIIEKDIKIRIIPVIKPDINIVNYVFNFVGNKSLEKLNELTSFIGKNVLDTQAIHTPDTQEFFASETEFTYDEYGDSPYQFLKTIGVGKDEWDRVKRLKVIRSAVMSPYLTPDYVDANYVERFLLFIEEGILKHREEIKNIYKKLGRCKVELEKTIYRVRDWIEAMVGRMNVNVREDGSMWVIKGSAIVDVIFTELENNIWIVLLSQVALNVPYSEELLNYLLRKNGELLFGAFFIRRNGESVDVFFRVSLLAKATTEEEFMIYFGNLLNFADDMDDEIVDKFGGEKMIEFIMRSKEEFEKGKKLLN